MSASHKVEQTVLIVEDCDDVRIMLCNLLNNLGYRVVEATNGEEAVEMAGREMPDLILMDLSLPRLDGFAAIHQIRKQAALHDIPIIAVSAHTDAEIRSDAMAAGCSEYIAKPVGVSHLQTTLERFLQ